MRNVFGDTKTDEASEAGRDQEGSWELGVQFALDSETVAGMGYLQYTHDYPCTHTSHF